MPRTARIDFPGLLQHVMVRGINRGSIFFGDADREDFRVRLSRLLKETGTECLAWALIPNHFHLLLRPWDTSMATFMRRLLTGHAVAVNLRNGRVGRLFQNRYKSIVCEEEPYLLQLVRYIHLNPLRADRVTSLEALERYPWGGHSVIMGYTAFEGQAVEEVLGRFGLHPETALARYKEFVGAGLPMGRRDELVGGGLRRRLALQGKTPEKESYDERVLGSGQFVDQLHARQQMGDRPPPNVTLPELVDRVCRALAVPHEQVCRHTKNPTANEARRIICHVAVRELGARGAEIGALLRLSPSGVNHAAARGRQRWQEAPLLQRAVFSNGADNA